MTPARLAELLGDWGYATYVFLLCATGAGSPVPEDLILATAGYLISAGVFAWPAAIAAGVFGVVASDAMLYGWGRRLGTGTRQGWMSRLVRPRHLARAEAWLTRMGGLSVFVARLVPGTRTVVFLGAGLRRMPFWQFLLIDLAGALVWVPLVLLLGAQLGDEIGGLDQISGNVQRAVLWAAGVFVVLLLLWRRWRAEESKW
jgi:membrane protein DedA with SNARE-associated domain